MGAQVLAMMPRTYQLQDVGVELFLQPAGRASVYLTFESPAGRDAAMRALAAQPALRLAAWRRRARRGCVGHDRVGSIGLVGIGYSVVRAPVPDVEVRPRHRHACARRAARAAPGRLAEPPDGMSAAKEMLHPLFALQLTWSLL